MVDVGDEADYSADQAEPEERAGSRPGGEMIVDVLMTGLGGKTVRAKKVSKPPADLAVEEAGGTTTEGERM